MKRRSLKKAAVVLAAIVIGAGLSAGCGAKNGGGSGSSGNSGAAAGVIAWAEGGGTDSVMRPLIEEVNRQGKRTINPENKTGMAGAMALQSVLEKPADGKTLLMTAENPALYEMIGYGDADFDDFDCVLLIGSETVGVIVPADSEWQSFSDLVNAAKSGREITEATTNVGGMPWTLTAMTRSVTGADFIQQWYAGDKAALEAVENGEADFTFCKLQIGEDAYRSGKVRYLTMVADTPVEGWNEVPLITEEYPAFSEYLPWGPFYGVYLKKGTEEKVRKEWEELFSKAYGTENYQTLLREDHIDPLGLNGDAAADYINSWKKKTVSALSGTDLNYKYRFKDAE